MKKIKQLETVVVHCLSQSETWHYKLAEKFFFFIAVHSSHARTGIKQLFWHVLFYFIAHVRVPLISVLSRIIEWAPTSDTW